MHPDPRLAVVALALVAVLAARGRRRAIAGAAVIALGSSALQVALGDASPTPSALQTLPALSVGLDAGLELLGALLALSASVAAFRAQDGASLAAAGLAAAAAIVAAWCGVRDAGPAGLGLPAAFAGIGAVAAAGVARFLRRERRSARVHAANHAMMLARWPWVIAAFGAIVVAAIAASGIAVIAAVAALAAIGFALVAARDLHWGIPWLPLVAIPPLALAGYLIFTIAAPTGLSLSALTAGPFSPAAEALIGALLALGGVGLFGLRPMQSIAPGSLLAVGGVALLIRLGAGVFPGGISSWETVAIPIGVVSIGFAAIAGDAVAAAAALAWITCFASGGTGGAWWLGMTASAGTIALWKPLGTGRLALGAALAAAGAWGGLLALVAVLRTETLYGVIGWFATAIALLRALPDRRD